MPAEYHVTVISRRSFANERVRREMLRVIRHAAGMFGWKGRIQFALYPIPGPPLGRDAIEVRVYPTR